MTGPRNLGTTITIGRREFALGAQKHRKLDRGRGEPASKPILVYIRLPSGDLAHTFGGGGGRTSGAGASLAQPGEPT